MENYKQINLNDYVQTGEGGTFLTYTHKTRNALAKLFNPETLKARWNIFLAAYLGTDDEATIAHYNHRLTAFYAARVPYMLDMQIHGQLPEEAFKPLSQLMME